MLPAISIWTLYAVCPALLVAGLADCPLQHEQGLYPCLGHSLCEPSWLHLSSRAHTCSTYAHTCAHTHVHDAPMATHTHIYPLCVIHTCMLTHMHLHAHNAHTKIYAHTSLHTCPQVQMHLHTNSAHIYTCTEHTHACAHTCRHVHTYIHTHST